MISRIINEILPIRNALIIMIFLSVIAYIVMMRFIGKLKVGGTGTKVPGLFVGLSGRSLFHLAFSWIKFSFFIATLICAKPVPLISYLIMLGFVIVSVVMNPKESILVEAANAVLAGGGFWMGTLLQNYLSQVKNDIQIVLSYWMMVIFLAFCATAVLIKEVQIISGERKWFNENGETD